MKLLSYIFTNTVTCRGFARKGFLWGAGILFLASVGFYIRANSFLSPHSIQGFLESDDIKQGLESAIFLQSGEYIDIQADAIVSNKTGAWFGGKDAILYKDLGSCEEVFNNDVYSENALVIIPTGVCIINNNKQQVLTVKQLREARSSVMAEVRSGSNTGFMSSYPVIVSLLSGDSIRIDNALLAQIVKTEIPTLFADREFLSGIDSTLRFFSGWIMIPLYIVGLFVVICVLIAILIIRIFYALCTRGMASILKKPIDSFAKACSVTWLPLLLLSLVLDTVILLPWRGDLLLFCGSMLILMNIYYVDNKETGVNG